MLNRVKVYRKSAIEFNKRYYFVMEYGRIIDENRIVMMDNISAIKIHKGNAKYDKHESLDGPYALMSRISMVLQIQEKHVVVKIVIIKAIIAVTV